MRNNTTVSLRILVVLLVCLLFIGGIAHAQSVAELRQAMDDARKLVKDEEAEHEEQNDHLNNQVANFVRLHGHLVGIELPSQSPATNTLSLTAKVAKIVEKLIQANLLTSTMEDQLAAIETQRATCNNLWADVLLAQTAYEDAIDAYNAAVSPNEQVTTVEVPQAPPVANLYLCPGPCSMAFTTQVLATTTHKVFCQEPPHNGSVSYSYYSCPPDYENICRAKAFHQTPCHGGCGKLFARNTGTLPRPDSVHIKQCDERTSRNFFNAWTGNCIGYYYNCNGQTSADCSNASQHLSSSSESLQACGHTYDPKSSAAHSHRSISYACSTHTYYACQTPSTSSHAWVSSCSETENGNTCNNSSGYYACAPHSHTYPSSSPVYTPPSSPTPTPTPTTVACGGASYTGCSGASSRTEHHVPSCSHCGNGYWTCGQYASRHTTQNTCQRPGCGVTYYECQNGTCTSDWGTNPYHWAQ